MALWTIKRLETNPNGDILSLACDSGYAPMKAVLHDSEANVDSVITVCVRDSVTPCSHEGGLLYLLAQAGYTPNDWDAECEP